MNEPTPMRVAPAVPASSEAEHPEELLDFARRGRLIDREWQELRAHLERCAPCALQHRTLLHASSDSLAGTGGADAQLERRAVQAVLRRIERPRQMAAAPAFLSRWTALGLAAVLMSGTALAASWWSARRSARFSSVLPALLDRPAASPRPSVGDSPPPELSGDSPSAKLDDQAEEEHQDEHEGEHEAGHDGALARDSVLGAGRALDARDLFARARGLRLHGRTGEALATYQRLQSTFPGSRESHLSHLVAGQLWLERGRLAPAIEQFGRYLDAGEGGASEEALVGRAVALGRMGRRAEEARDWRRLVAEYPKSVYVARASARLAALAAAAAAAAAPPSAARH